MNEGFGSRATVELSVREGIQAEVIHKTLDRLFELSGCPACGLLGIDLRFRVLDDDFSRRFEKVLTLPGRGGEFEGLQGVSVLEGGGR